MSFRNLATALLLVVALSIAGKALAVPLTYRTFVGSMNNFNSFGELGFIHGLAADGKPTDGSFGAAFDSRVTVNSIVIDQRVDPGRHRFKDLRIYTSPFTFTSVQLADAQGPQTITLPGAGLTSDYFYMSVESFYDAGAFDDNPGLHALTFDGSVGTTRTNLNAGILPDALNQFEPENFFLDVITNGQNVSTTGGPVDYLFFEHADTVERSITVSYGSPQDVASIGLAFEGQIPFSYNSRPVPKFVTVTDSNGNSQNVTLAPHTLQYGQYPLTTPVADTTSLKLTLPVGVENYYLAPLFDPNQPVSTLTGIVEFEAFADAVVPPVEDADFDNDGDVDGRDFLIWQRGFGTGTTNTTGDADNNGSVNAADLAIWQDKYGTGPLVAVSAIPEPSSLALLLFGGLCLRRRN